MICGIHFSTELETKIDVTPRGCFKPLALTACWISTAAGVISLIQFGNGKSIQYSQHSPSFIYLSCDHCHELVINILVTETHKYDT